MTLLAKLNPTPLLLKNMHINIEPQISVDLGQFAFSSTKRLPSGIQSTSSHSSWSRMLLLGSMQACQRTSNHGALSFRHLVHSRSPSLMEFSRISLSEDPSNYKAFAENTRKDRKLSDVLGQEKLQVLAQSLDYQPLCAINTFMRSGHWRLGRILCLLLWMAFLASLRLNIYIIGWLLLYHSLKSFLILCKLYFCSTRYIYVMLNFSDTK